MDKNSPSIYENNLFSNHFLGERIQDTEKWQQTDVEEKFDELKKLYDSKSDLLSEKLNEDQTQSEFINPVLKALGHKWVPEARTRVGSKKKGTILNPDYTFMDMETQMDVHEDEEKSYFDVNYAVGDAKAWNRKLDKSTQDHSNPAFQIYNYVDRLRADWGILTNGKKWRLYSYEKCAADIYFEVDLENLLKGEKTEEKLEQFKYFYLLFEQEGFEQGFLQKVYQESVNFAEGLEDDLEDKVYNALEVAVEGFFETNNLDKTVENIDLVHHASLIFLYRILFILNAESRDLLPTEDKAYQQAFGLMELKRMIVEGEETHIFQDTTIAWDKRISRLFEGIDDGYDLSETEIPAYNGGLFNEEESEENQFLSRNKLYGSYIKEILELLATSYDEEKQKRIILDYKDLNIRHLGSVYEGLLEHKFKAADERKILKNSEWTDFSETNKDWEEFDEEKRVQENELYLTNESGERKATGSYYTPEYIVEYIVENTVGPKVEEKIKGAEENDSNVLTKILELNICDPAMGSGHFLTEATEYIAEHIVQHADLEKQNLDENEDELNWAKRQVVQNCIYGVDVNELAVELGKLSLWIETAARGKPLNFLDHHLKHGNSLIGSNFDEIFSHPTEDQKRLDSERYQFGDPQEIKESFQEQYREIEEMPENTVEQIHEKEQAYKQFISQNTLYQQFQQLANIHTRQFFESEANSSDYESFLINIGNPSNPFEGESWYQNAQSDAENRNYFHWQLEFPKVFFGDQNGFDAVIGNPPYFNAHTLPQDQRDYFQSRESWKVYQGGIDVHYCFDQKAIDLSGSGKVGYITSRYWIKADHADKLRKYILDKKSVEKLIDFQSNEVFPDAGIHTSIFILGEDVSEASIWKTNESLGEKGLTEKLYTEPSFKLNLKKFGADPWVLSDPKKGRILEKLDQSQDLDNFAKARKGMGTGKNSVFILDKEDIEKYDIEKSLIKNCIRNGDVQRFRIEDRKKLLYTENVDNISNYPNARKYLEDNKEALESRKDHESEWFKLRRPQSHKLQDKNKEKVFCPYRARENTFAFDAENSYSITDTTFITLKEDSEVNYAFLESVLNSSLLTFYYKEKGKDKGGVLEYFAEPISDLPIEIGKEEQLIELAEKMRELKQNSFNLNIQDYLGNYSDGKTLGDLYTPAEGLSDKVVSDTSADRDSLRIGGVEFEERNGDLVLKVSARYKPDDSEGIDEDELDRWGYFETEKVPAMKFNVDDKMRPLIEEFVSLAVDEAGGFAGFRESATKTNSVTDRLEKLTLPKLEDVEQGLEKFIENREEAEELEEEIQETDELIDAIVFDLYDLTEEEVKTVLDSLDTEEGERASILEKFREVK